MPRTRATLSPIAQNVSSKIRSCHQNHHYQQQHYHHKLNGVKLLRSLPRFPLFLVFWESRVALCPRFVAVCKSQMIFFNFSYYPYTFSTVHVCNLITVLRPRSASSIAVTAPTKVWHRRVWSSGNAVGFYLVGRRFESQTRIPVILSGFLWFFSVPQSKWDSTSHMPWLISCNFFQLIVYQIMWRWAPCSLPAYDVVE
jgi:hypothetical protein